MATWKSKICRGMDVVETITFTREGLNSEGILTQVSAVYVPGANEQKPREEWTQEEIDTIGEKLVFDLDKNLLESKTPKLI
jgi:hypothetical protein